MGLPKIDTFSGGSNSEPLSIYNPNWIAQVNGLQFGFQPKLTGSIFDVYNFSYWGGDIFENDQYSQIVIAGPQASGPTVRASGLDGAANCYMFDCNDSSDTNTYLFKLVLGSFSLLQTFNTTFDPNDVARIEVEGTTIRCYKNGVQLGTDTTDSDLSSGFAGLMIKSADVPGALLPNFEGGNLSVPPPPVTTTDFTTQLEIGELATLTKDIIYALPTLRCSLFKETSAAVLEVAMDVAFTNPITLTLDTNKQVNLAAMFIRSTVADAVVSIKTSF